MLRKATIFVAMVFCAGVLFAQDKPYPITENDPGFLDLAVEQIYLRVRARVDSLINDYIDTDTLKFLHAHGDTVWVKAVEVDTLAANNSTRLYVDGILTVMNNLTSVAGIIDFREMITNGDKVVRVQAPMSMTSSRTQTLQDAAGTIALTADVWSRTGDTLMQSGVALVPAGDTEDTIGLPTAYTAKSSYEVMLTWINTTGLYPSGAADTLNVIKTASGSNQYKVDSFIVEVPYSGAKTIGWITVGN